MHVIRKICAILNLSCLWSPVNKVSTSFITNEFPSHMPNGIPFPFNSSNVKILSLPKQDSARETPHTRDFIRFSSSEILGRVHSSSIYVVATSEVRFGSIIESQYFRLRSRVPIVAESRVHRCGRCG